MGRCAVPLPVGATVFFMLLSCGCDALKQAPPDLAADASSPDQVIAQFLEAVRSGDDKQAAALLTPLAQRKTAEKEMVVSPPGSETATFRVRGIELADGKAQAITEWTDLDSDGLRHTDEIVWLLRRETEGWRIWGMTSKVFEDQDPIVLNFEEPEEMMRRQQLAEEELARREQRHASQGGNSVSPPSPDPRR